MVRRVIVVRHGERQDMIDPGWAYTSPMPWDPPLSQTGEKLVAELAARVSEEITPGAPVRLYCSPFLRCVQTALPVAQATGSRIQLASVFGEWMTPEYFEHGVPPPDDHSSIAASSLAWALRHGAANAKLLDFTSDTRSLGPSGTYGEEWAEMHSRVIKGLDKVLADGSDGVFIIVTHGSACNSLMGALRGVPQVEDVPLASFTSIDV